MKLDVYDITNTTLQGTLTQAHSIEFIDDLTIPGFARFQLDAASTTDLALCTPRRIVRFRTGASAGTGDVFAAIIQDRPTTLNDTIQPEGSVSTVTVECRGLLSWLGNREGGAVLYPQGGLDGRQQNPRLFGWQTQDFVDTSWDQVVTARTAGALSTDGWPDDQAVAFVPVYEGDRALYRRFLPALTVGDKTARMYLAATVRTQVTVWLDGEIVLEKPSGQSGLFFEDVPYDDVDHQLAVEVIGGTGRWGWTWMSTDIETDVDGNEQVVGVTALRRTFDPADFPSADTDWKYFEGGSDAWQGAAFVAGDEWVRPVADGPLTTAGWPDASAVAYFSAPGRGRFFRQIESSTSIADTVITVAAESRASVRVFVNSTEVLYKPTGGRGLFTSDPITYPGADFVLSVVVVGGGRWGLTWRESDDTVIRRTYDPETYVDADPWLYAPDETPGVSVGFVLNTALTEDGVRHPDRPWTWDFTASADSGSTAWKVSFSRGFRMQEVGLLVDELVSIEGEPEMTPAGVLRWFLKRGTDRTATVTLDAPFALELTGRGPQATRWLYETPNGFGQIMTDGPEATYGVMERYVQLGSDIGGPGAGQLLQRQVDLDAQLVDEFTVDVPDDLTPYDDFWVGDTIECVGRSATVEVRVTSVQASVEDGNGHVSWTVTGVPA